MEKLHITIQNTSYSLDIQAISYL